VAVTPLDMGFGCRYCAGGRFYFIILFGLLGFLLKRGVKALVSISVHYLTANLDVEW